MDSVGKILIIDDEQVVIDSCKDILASSSHHVTTASDGAGGLKLIQEDRPDLVFVDLKMPGMTGMQVLEKISEIDPTIVTVVITGYATISSAVEAMKRGAYDFLPKPFTPAEFRMITSRSLEKRRLTLETQSLRREKEMLRKNFAAIVSHEMKSPLSSIQQNLYVLLAELANAVSEDQRNRLERMQERIADLIKLVNTWLQIMTIDLQAVREHFTKTSIEDVITKSVEVVQTHAARKNIDIEIDIPDSSCQVFGDEGTLVEVMVNLLSNAIKYSYSGRKVKVAVEQLDRRLLVSVSDQGVGIAKQELPYIFDDFYRGKGRLGETESHGLGLALSKKIIEIHDGAISVDSRVGEGSTFVVSLPKMENEPEKEPALEANGQRK